MGCPPLDFAIRNSCSHDLTDGTGFPLRRKIQIAQCLSVKLFGTYPVTRVILQKRINHARLCIFLHKIFLANLQGFLHGRAECQLIITAVVNRHGFCPKLVDIGTGFRFVIQNMYFSLCCIHRDGDKASVSCTVTGEKILSVGRTCKDTLPQTVCRVRFIRDFVGFFLLAEKALDFFNAFGIGSRNHFRHFHDPVALQLAEHVIIVQSPQIIREPFIFDSKQPEKRGFSCTLPTDQAKHHFKLAAGMKHPFDRSKQKNFQCFRGKLIFCGTEKAMQSVAYPLCAIPLQVIQVVPDRVIMIFVGNNANCCRHPFFAVQAVFFHSAQNVHHIGVGQCRARTLPAHRLYNINAFTQQIQPDGICKNRVVLQNGHTVLNRVLNTTLFSLREHFADVGNGRSRIFGFVGQSVEPPSDAR